MSNQNDKNGVSIAYKLAVMTAYRDGQDITVINRENDITSIANIKTDDVSRYFNWEKYCYNIILEKAKVPLTQEDIPAICWLRGSIKPEIYGLVTATSPDGVTITERYMTYQELMNTNFEYSQDCKNWKPCWKIV